MITTRVIMSLKLAISCPARPTDQTFHMSHNALCDRLMTGQLEDLMAQSEQERPRTLLDSGFASGLTEFQVSPSSSSYYESLLDPMLRSTDLSATPEVSYLTTGHSFSSIFA